MHAKACKAQVLEEQPSPWQRKRSSHCKTTEVLQVVSLSLSFNSAMYMAMHCFRLR